MKTLLVAPLAFLALAFLSTASFAAGTAAGGGLTITAPWLRATPHGASVAGGYVMITNKGTTPDRLLRASLPIAPRGEVHSMSMANGVMHMERLDRGLPVPPGATVALTPGGYHLMFLNPKAQLKPGERVSGTLTFEKAGTIPVTFAVAGIGAKTAPDETAPDEKTPDEAAVTRCCAGPPRSR